MRLHPLRSLALLLAVSTLARCFNLEPHHALVIGDPEADPGSYFGYALGFWRQSVGGLNSTWLLVGAPQAQEDGLRGERVRQPGAVYKCDVSHLDTHSRTPRCVKLTILGKEDRQEQDLRWRRKVANIPKRAWIGATITTENVLNGAAVACAPRMKQMKHPEVWSIPGMCYYWKTDDFILPLAPLETAPIYRSIQSRQNGFISGLAMSGIAAHFVENTTRSQLVVGAPGLKYFRGGMNVYEQTMHSDVIPSLFAPELLEYGDSYLGYAVSSAKLHSNGRVTYLVGGPRGTGQDYYTGVVYLMSGAHQSQWSLETKLEGHQMGEYFGACVASMDLNLDGIDDLVLVGAPLHSLKEISTGDTWEQGRLYIYKNLKEGRLEMVSDILLGSSAPGARFASSLSVIGDLNKDGYNDLAVGAPYEGSGAVYIYHGGRHGLSSVFSQRIYASDIRQDLRGFGFSLASGTDLDGNSFNDLAVGSYDSADVVVIRSYPIVELEASLRPAVNNLDVNADSMTITACVMYSSNANPDLLPFVDAEVILKADSTLKRAMFESGGHMQALHLRLKRDSTHCWEEHITFKGNLMQKMQPVEFFMYYRVAENSKKNEGTFCKTCPVTDPQKPTSVHVKIPFANGCGGKSTCLADLRMEVTSSNKGKAIVLGQDKKIKFKVSVINLHEPAYLVKMSLTTPRTTGLVKMPKHCYQEEEDESVSDSNLHVITCGLGNVMESDQHIEVSERTTKFEVDLSSVELGASELVFNLTTWSSSEEQNPIDNSAIFVVPVELATDMGISGNTMQKHLVLSSDEDDHLPPVISVVHKYEITNFGPSPIGELNVSSSLPFGLIVDQAYGTIIFVESINPKVTIRGHTVRCHVDYSTLNIQDGESRRKREIASLEANETEIHLTRSVFYLNCSEPGLRRAACALVTCPVGPLDSGDTAEVKLQFNINKTMIDMMQEKDIIHISSSAWMKIPEEYKISTSKRTKMADVSTMLVGKFEEKVSPWVLLLSAVLGLFLLAIMATGLSKVGFFHRKYKENMESMRDELDEGDVLHTDRQ